VERKYIEIDAIRHVMQINNWKLRHIAAIAKCSVPTASRYMRKLYSMPQGRKTRILIAAVEATEQRLTALLKNKEYTK
jgi:hypothetical protein